MSFEELKVQIEKCRLCQEKFGFEPHPVIFGNQNAKIVQISQAPSANVHITRKPFTDLSGKKLKYEWYDVDDKTFYNEDNFYIASLAHCFPGKNPNGGDRLPPKICYEMWIKKEIELVNNQLYIIIGSKAANIFFPGENYNELIFKNNSMNGKLAIVLPHPSPLNIKWFKDNPKFYEERLIEIKNIVKEVLKGDHNHGLNEDSKRCLSK